MDGPTHPGSEVLVGIDVGTTNVRAGVYDTSGRLMALAARPAAGTRPDGVLDPEALWRRITAALGEALAAARADRAPNVRGIAVAGIGCVPVFLDRDGVALALPADGDVREWGLRRLEERTTAAEFRARTGYPFDSTTVACRLAAASVEVKARIAAAMSVPDFIAFRLTGIVAHERSTAASFALWDAQRGGWWTELLDGIGIDPAAFGTVVESAQPIGTVLPDVADALGLPEGTLVSTGGHDYLTAALAAGVGPGRGILDVAGTLEIVATIHHASEPVADDPTVRAMRDHHVVPGQRSWMIEAFAASAIERLRPTDGSGSNGSELDGAEEYGSRDPLAAAFAELDHAVLSGDDVRSPLAARLRSAIVDLCLQASDMIDRQVELLGIAGADVTVVGGGSRSPAWNQIKAGVLGRPIRVPRIREASALGAALLAGVGAGVYGDLDEAAGVAIDLGADIVEPSEVRA